MTGQYRVAQTSPDYIDKYNDYYNSNTKNLHIKVTGEEKTYYIWL